MGFRQSSKRIESIKIVNIIIITFHEDVKRRSRQKRGPDLSSVLLKKWNDACPEPRREESQLLFFAHAR